jgi:hypothetical protein
MVPQTHSTRHNPGEVYMTSGATAITHAPGARRRPPASRASLSVFMMTAGPGPRVAALLGALRPVADEILVALDDRADAAVRRDLAAVADRIVLYPFAEPVDRPLPWLFGQCRCDWALALDDDEIPSLALLEALPALCADPGVTHYWLPRQWLYPDSSTYLDEAPWRPDYQPRLVRADPRVLRFSAEFHRPMVVSGPGRYPQLPLWHADPLLRSFAQRVAKSRRYERTRPGMRVGAYALNFAFYLPENRESLRLEPVPADERALIDSVLGADAPIGAETAEVTNVTRTEIDAVWPESELTRHAGRLELLDGADRLVAGEQRTFDVRVWNDSDAAWPWGWDSVPEVRVGSRWYDESGVEARESQLRTAFPAPLAPGRSDVVPVHVLAPQRPGRYRLEIDLIQEHVRWFGVGVDCDVLVRSRRRVAVLGDDEATADIAQLLETLPELEVVQLRPHVTGRDGYAEAPCIRRYLFGDVPASRGAFIVTLVTRTLRLTGAVARARLRRPGSLPRGGGEFLATLRDCELLVLAELDAPPHRREYWRVAAIAQAAAAFGVPVAIRRGLMTSSGLLAGVINGRATLQFDDPSELLPLLAHRR